MSAGSLRIDGQVKGQINAEGDVLLSPQSQVEADIRAQNVVVAGRFKGTITVKGRAELARGGRVDGDITSKTLVVEEGGIFQGQSIMDQQPAQARRRRPLLRRRAPLPRPRRPRSRCSTSGRSGRIGPLPQGLARRHLADAVDRSSPSTSDGARSRFASRSSARSRTGRARRSAAPRARTSSVIGEVAQGLRGAEGARATARAGRGRAVGSAGEDAERPARVGARRVHRRGRGRGRRHGEPPAFDFEPRGPRRAG